MAHLSLNGSLGVFIPRGEEDAAPRLRPRRPEGTRPLHLNRTDNKCVAGVADDMLAKGPPSWARSAQHGFAQGTQGLDKVCELDARANGTDIRRQREHDERNKHHGEENNKDDPLNVALEVDPAFAHHGAPLSGARAWSRLHIPNVRATFICCF